MVLFDGLLFSVNAKAQSPIQSGTGSRWNPFFKDFLDPGFRRGDRMASNWRQTGLSNSYCIGNFSFLRPKGRS